MSNAGTPDVWILAKDDRSALEVVRDFVFWELGSAGFLEDEDFVDGEGA